jgi:lipopolysaccharide/colanic/teichoic acid biosynthesis glycosyltransferase
MKRLFDFFCSSLGLLLLWPILLLIAFLIKIEDRGPVLFRQTRVGRHGGSFFIWKFRTMVPNASQLGIPLTIGHDPRITRIGHWLRKSKLDEIPQLFNVLVGQMSLVGPRPEVAKYVNAYTPKQRKVLELSPGLTDVASVQYCNESEILATAKNPEKFYLENIVPAKIHLNLTYAQSATVWTDFLVILKTFGRLLKL